MQMLGACMHRDSFGCPFLFSSRCRESLFTSPMTNQRTVLVTGGTSGIGRATAIAFAHEGARVFVVGRDSRRGGETIEAIRRIRADAEYIQADVAVAADARRIVDTIVARAGRLDVAVNSAGSIETGAFKETTALEEAEFEQHVAANLKSVWLCMKFEIAQMLAQPAGGAIINVSSINGLGGVPQNSAYAASKAGVLALTKSAALEYASRGVRINALVAGGFRTPMLESVFAHMSPGDPEAAAQMYAGMVPAGRVGDPQEAAAAIVWLASNAASYVVGHSLIVDGGVTAPYR